MMCDVLVAGAGPSGSAVARLLALKGHKVVLLDEPASGPRVGESLPGAALSLLAQLQLLDCLHQSQPEQCIGNLSSWGDGILRGTDFIRDPQGAGWHLDRQQFDTCLRQAAIAVGVIPLYQRLRKIERTREGWRVLSHDQCLTARWLVDASGRNAVVARRLGVGRHKDPPLIAVYAWGGNLHHDRRTLIEPVACGWWYTAPLPAQRRVAAIHVLASEAALLRRGRAAWAQRMGATTHVCQVVRPHALWSQPRATDASGSALAQPAGDAWLAVGDAALAFDPLSSQGLFNAFYTALRGGQAIHEALCGEPRSVERYVERIAHIWQTYQHNVRYYYAAEQRWPSHPFWQHWHCQ
jgi:flavin-dependent dehydrogenase